MFKLIIQDDEGKTTVVPLIRDEITIGRKEGNTIRLTERNVSRRHARLVRGSGNIVIEDLDSYNGIRVNGTRIAGRVQVAETDRIQIGDYLLELKLDRAATPQPGGPFEDQRTQPIERIDGAPAVGSAAPTAPTQQIKSNGAANGAPQPVGDHDPTTRHEARHTPEAAAAPAAAPVVDSDAPARLVCISTNFAGKEFLLERPAMVIGRTDDNDVVVNHRSISRHHAKIVREHGRYAIVDLQSSNGVRVNGEEYGKVELRRGDMVDLGHVRLRFVEAGEDFVFSRDATVVDLASEVSGRNKKPLIIGAGVVLVGGVIAVIAFSGGDSKPTTKAAVPGLTVRADAGALAAIESDAADIAPEGPNGAAVTKKLAEANDALAAEDWSAALAIASQVLELDQANAEARAIATKARAETDARTLYEEFLKQARSGKAEAAFKSYLKIPEGSIYLEKAAPEYDKLVERWIAEALAGARKLADGGKCDAIAPIKRRVGETLPDRADVMDQLDAETRRCLAGTPRDRPPPDRPPPDKPPPDKPPPDKPPPDKPPPAFDQAKWDGLRQEAMDSSMQGLYGQALKKAEEAMGMGKSDDQLNMTAAVAGCKLKKADTAKKYLSRLPAGKKNSVKQVCRDSGVELD